MNKNQRKILAQRVRKGRGYWRSLFGSAGVRMRNQWVRKLMAVPLDIGRIYSGPNPGEIMHGIERTERNRV